jgi:hypothetical protein
MHFPWYPSGQVEISTSARNLLTGFAFPARYFSLLRQRKVPKRKADPKTCPLTRVPCASRHFGRSPNSQDLPRLAACKSSSNRAARSIPKCLRCSAAPTGFTLLVVVQSALFLPVLWVLCAILSRHPGAGRDPSAFNKDNEFRGHHPKPRLAQPSIAGETGASSRPVRA